MPAIDYLKKLEWSMGNGQCPECCGCDPDARWWTEKVGHRDSCPLASSLQELGHPVTWKRHNFERDERMKNPKTVRDHHERDMHEWSRRAFDDALLRQLTRDAE